MTSVMQRLQGMSDGRDREALRLLLPPIADRFSTQNLVSPALAIKASSSAVVASTAAIVAFVQGVLVTVAAGDMPALSGTVANAKFNVFAFFVDRAGTVTSVMGTAGSTLNAVVFPEIPVGKALIGFVIVNPTGTGNFVGGTTALDNATVVPNAVYVNVTGAVSPQILP